MANGGAFSEQSFCDALEWALFDVYQAIGVQ
jgi:hypothetical protein